MTKISLYKDRATKLLQKSKLKPTFGKKKDPAHPPVHPTGKKPRASLPTDQDNVYKLIACRYLAIFGDPSVRRSLRLDIDLNGHTFHLRGMKVLKRGWLELYAPFGKVDEVELPDLAEGDRVTLEIEKIGILSNPVVKES